MKHSTRRRLTAGAGPVAVLALMALSRGAEAQTFIAPSSETITSETEVRDVEQQSHLIFVQNRSTVPVIVFSVGLAGCENIKGSCGARKTKVQVGPGARRMVLRVEPKVRDRAFAYRFSFSWHADSSYGTQLRAAMAAAGDARSRDQLASQMTDSVGRPDVIVAPTTDPEAPFFSGRVVAAETRRPMSCARIALEDKGQNVVGRARTDPTGIFVIQAPRAGAYRVRVESHGWAPAYGPVLTASTGEDNQREYVVAFTEQMLTSVPENRSEYERARPVALSTPRIGAAPTTPLDQVTLGGSESMPILGIVGRFEPMTAWIQFVVDTAGRVDTASVSVPAATPANAIRSVKSVLPRVRFSPAKDNGRVTCEMMRMQVSFGAK